MRALIVLVFFVSGCASWARIPRADLGAPPERLQQSWQDTRFAGSWSRSRSPSRSIPASPDTRARGRGRG